MHHELYPQEKPFLKRHLGPSEAQQEQMLATLGVSSLSELIDQTIPESIQLKEALQLPAPLTESEFSEAFKAMASKNKVFRSFIGMGYHDCTLPPVIQRNILENPGWYTAYTPYQAEIAQGRLEALINFQTLVTDLTGMEIANASLLDEGTAAAEAMTMLYRVKSKAKKAANKFFVDAQTFPQTIDLLKGRAAYVGIEIVIGQIETLDFTNPDLYGIYLQYPDNNGAIRNPAPWIEQAIANDVKTAIGADILSLALLTPPGEMGADVVLGTTQRLGIPLGYGGPHAAYYATKEAYKRQIPGRIIGVSTDAQGKTAYRMALQTREQHIKRDKATSNICTAQVLLAVMAGMYAVYHGEEGIKNIARRIHILTSLLGKNMEKLGYRLSHSAYFDTLKIEGADTKAIQKEAEAQQINFRYFADGAVGVSLNEKTTLGDVEEIVQVFAKVSGKTIAVETTSVQSQIPESNKRASGFLKHPVFQQYQTEHEILRYIKRLENKDLSLVHSMISLGSCTMKLNATTEMMPLSWPEWGNIHPFVPTAQSQGYQQLFEELSQWLSDITGFHATSLQPNSGAQGELAGLMVIKAYFESIGEGHRDITLIPSSAHGTNPASAAMAGQQVVIVKCHDNGDIDLDDLKEKATKHQDHLMALMITYPSTHGVFETSVKEVCEMIHAHGGRVYMDGANMNAQIGLTNPATIGADVCHLNLHKTFCIPHGGGGPGMGPIAVTKELAPFLPGSEVIAKAGGEQPIHAISAAPWGSASILTISYAYIAMMGHEGLKQATEIAILNANYIKERLKAHYPILFTGANGRNAHELIIDCRGFKEAGVVVTDIAKRLIDYGFHAPTVSFPVAGTLMIEPTESETLEELDRFCEALIGIRKEIAAISTGQVSKEQNVLKNAPHTQEVLLADAWVLPYSRTEAAYPADFVRERKVWPTVSRIDDAYGDRNLMCSCPPVEAYEESSEAAVAAN